MIKQVKANTGYFPNKTVAELYKQIFQPTGAWEAKATMWERIGATKGYQKLITVDADTVQNPNYKTITDHTYYRQRITLHKQDEDGKGLGGIKFTLSADNLDDLYSFGKYDCSGESANSADGYVTADVITYQIKSVMASSVAENPTDTVASGSAVTVNPVSGSAVSGETGISYTSVVAVKQKDGTFVDHTDDKIIMVDEQTHIQLLKLDKETGQALGGAKFVITDSKGNKVMKFVTKDDAYDITGKLVVGETYTFTEVSAPSAFCTLWRSQMRFRAVALRSITAARF